MTGKNSLFSPQTRLLFKKVFAASLYYTNKIKTLQKEATPSWRILMYHRVINPEEVAYPIQPGMYVRPQTFKKQMGYLANHCNVVSLDTLTASVEKGETLPPKTVALTFDDGWLDNYLFAYPILKKHNLPATIFIATGFIDTPNLFWTDRLSRALFSLWQAKKDVQIELEEKKVGLSPATAKLILEVLEVDEWEELVDTIHLLIEVLKLTALDDRNQILDTIYGYARSYIGIPKERVFLRWEEVQEMSEGGVSFGSHSHYHRILPEIPDEDVKKEIEVSYVHLKRNLKNFSMTFCYPSGEYSKRSQEILKEAGVLRVLGARPQSLFEEEPQIYGRIGIHEDISSTLPLFSCRIWAKKWFS